MIFAIGSQICRHPTIIPALGWEVTFISFSPTCKPAPLTSLVHTPSDHFPGTRATLTLLPSSQGSCCSILVSIEAFSSSLGSTPDIHSRAWLFARNSSYSIRIPSWPTSLMKLLRAYISHEVCPLKVLGNSLGRFNRVSLSLQCSNIFTELVNGCRTEWPVELSKSHKAQWISAVVST